MLVINKYKPFYVDIENKTIRMGNFPETGKEINYEDDSLIDIFSHAKYPIDEEELLDIISKNNDIQKENVRSAIDYLKKEEFLISYDDYEKTISDERYSRHNAYFNMFSIDNRNIPADVKILVLGLGGIGANVVTILERAGFKNFVLVDCDTVELSNLTKQFPYTNNDIGKAKTEALKLTIKEKDVNIETHNISISKAEDIETYIEKADFVISTIDKPFRIIRRLINELSVKHGKPVIFAGFTEHVGMVGPFVIPGKTSCLMCTEQKSNETPLQNVEYAPSYGPLCLVISSIVSNEIINYYIKYTKSNLQGKTLMFNMANYEIEIINWEKNKDCEVCKTYDS